MDCVFLYSLKIKEENLQSELSRNRVIFSKHMLQKFGVKANMLEIFGKSLVNIWQGKILRILGKAATVTAGSGIWCRGVHSIYNVLTIFFNLG